jgi:hypothetical protein
MLAVVGNAERLLVVIRPVRSMRDLGEGRFVVDRGVTVGRLTVGRTGTTRPCGYVRWRTSWGTRPKWCAYPGRLIRKSFAV